MNKLRGKTPFDTIVDDYGYFDQRSKYSKFIEETLFDNRVTNTIFEGVSFKEFKTNNDDIDALNMAVFSANLLTQNTNMTKTTRTIEIDSKAYDSLLASYQQRFGDSIKEKIEEAKHDPRYQLDTEKYAIGKQFTYMGTDFTIVKYLQDHITIYADDELVKEAATRLDVNDVSTRYAPSKQFFYNSHVVAEFVHEGKFDTKGFKSSLLDTLFVDYLEKIGSSSNYGDEPI